MEARKRKKYMEKCKNASLIFCPFTIKSYSATTDVATNYILDPLIQGIKDFTPINWTARTAKSFWYQRLSLNPVGFKCQKGEALPKRLLRNKCT